MSRFLPWLRHIYSCHFYHYSLLLLLFFLPYMFFLFRLFSLNILKMFVAIHSCVRVRLTTWGAVCRLKVKKIVVKKGLPSGCAFRVCYAAALSLSLSLSLSLDREASLCSRDRYFGNRTSPCGNSSRGADRGDEDRLTKRQRNGVCLLELLLIV